MGHHAHYDFGVRTLPTDLLALERSLLAEGHLVVGIDEVGRGALAGPLTVGAVVITCDAEPPSGLTDSKVLRAREREALIEPIERWCAAWSLGSVSATEIDRWGLRLALAVAATRAMDRLPCAPTHALIDGSFNLPVSYTHLDTSRTRPRALERCPRRPSRLGAIGDRIFRGSSARGARPS